MRGSEGAILESVQDVPGRLRRGSSFELLDVAQRSATASFRRPEGCCGVLSRIILNFVHNT